MADTQAADPPTTSDAPCPDGPPPRRPHHWLVPNKDGGRWVCARCGAAKAPPAPRPRSSGWSGNAAPRAG